MRALKIYGFIAAGFAGQIACQIAFLAAASFATSSVLFAPSAAADAVVPPVPQLAPRPPVPAKKLFGAQDRPADLATRSIGFYSRGCLSGGKALPVDGPNWQAMRLSRNRNWGHPKLIRLIEKLARDAARYDGWPGLLVGDLTQPRGGPMLSGHASHQVGLDADVWLNPMPDRRLNWEEREKTSAVSMLKNTLSVDPKVFTPAHVKLIKRAASYPEVERIGVNPAIKLALCRAEGGDKPWLGKIQGWRGHHYHMHIRIACPPGSKGCESQPPPRNTSCADAEQWYRDTKAYLELPKKPQTEAKKPRKPKPPIMLSDLPDACRGVLAAEPAGAPDPIVNKIVAPPKKPMHRAAAARQ